MSSSKQDSIHDDTSIDDPTPWRCRECCRQGSASYRYPTSHDLYCSGCRQPMDAQERLTAALGLLVSRLEALAVSPGPLPLDTGALETSELLTVVEAASVLRLTPKAVRNRIDRGQLPVIRLGRTVRIRRRHLLPSPSERRAPSPGGTRR